MNNTQQQQKIIQSFKLLSTVESNNNRTKPKQKKNYMIKENKQLFIPRGRGNKLIDSKRKM